jgi:hypothetical protein
VDVDHDGIPPELEQAGLTAATLEELGLAVVACDCVRATCRGWRVDMQAVAVHRPVQGSDPIDGGRRPSIDDLRALLSPP